MLDAHLDKLFKQNQGGRPLDPATPEKPEEPGQPPCQTCGSPHNHLLTYVHLAFMEDLWALAEQIDKRNDARPVRFEACNPAFLESSVSI